MAAGCDEVVDTGRSLTVRVIDSPGRWNVTARMAGVPLSSTSSSSPNGRAGRRRYGRSSGSTVCRSGTRPGRGRPRRGRTGQQHGRGGAGGAGAHDGDVVVSMRGPGASERGDPSRARRLMSVHVSMPSTMRIRPTRLGADVDRSWSVPGAIRIESRRIADAIRTAAGQTPASGRAQGRPTGRRSISSRAASDPAMRSRSSPRAGRRGRRRTRVDRRSIRAPGPGSRGRGEVDEDARHRRRRTASCRHRRGR